MQHAYWLEKRKTVRVSTPALRGAGTQGLRRPRFPFFILQCQRAGGSAAKATLPNPQWKQNHPWESTTAEVTAGMKRPGHSPFLSDKIARSRSNPLGSGSDPR